MLFRSIDRPRVGAAFLCACVSLAFGCSSPSSGDPALGLEHDPIYGGVTDPTDDAVLALIRVGNNLVGSCTGTTIAKSGGSGFLVTAGHCVAEVDAQGAVVLPVRPAGAASLFVLPGPDYATDHSSVFRVADAKLDPQYDGGVSSPYDIAIVRYVGANSATAVIPTLTPDDDALLDTSTLTIVGFGVTESDKQNTLRRKVDKSITHLTAQQIVFDQTDGKGTCEGDSGGPALFQTPQGVRVAAVTSYGDATCSQLGVSVRTSPAYSFLQGFIDSAPPTLSCTECRWGSTAPGNPCAAKYADCENSSTPCGQFNGCAQGCTTPTCVNTCRANNRAGAAANDALGQCECSDVCSGSCSGDAACSAPLCGGLAVPGAACTGCIQQHCCTEAAACGGDDTCGNCFGSSDKACPTNPLYHALLVCLSSCAANPCVIDAASLEVEGGAARGSDASEGGAADTQDAGTSSSSDGSSLVSVQASASGGCGCRVGGAVSPRWAARAPAAFLLLLAMARRRRRPDGDLARLPS